MVVCMQTCAGARSMSFLCRADGTDGLDYAYLSSLPGAPGGSALCILLSGLAALKLGPILNVALAMSLSKIYGCKFCSAAARRQCV